MTEPAAQTWVLASNNPGKVAELQALLADTGLRVQAQSAWAVPPIDEPHPSFVENALRKARHASACTGLPALADDSGLCIEALQGGPGVHSACWAGPVDPPLTPDQANNAKLVTSLRGLAQRNAYFYCVLVVVRSPHDSQPLIADGFWWGEIIDQARGTAGFGYDPHFFLPEWGCTSAELAPEIKNQLSHRGQAMRALREKLAAARLIGAAFRSEG